MRYNVDFFVKGAKAEKAKGLSREELYSMWKNEFMRDAKRSEIQKGQFVGDAERNKVFIDTALNEVYDGIPRPFASPEDVVDTERDAELKKLEAEKIALEKDEKIKNLREEVQKLKRGKSESGKRKASDKAPKVDRKVSSDSA